MFEFYIGNSLAVYHSAASSHNKRSLGRSARNGLETKDIRAIQESACTL